MQSNTDDYHIRWKERKHKKFDPFKSAYLYLIVYFLSTFQHLSRLKDKNYEGIYAVNYVSLALMALKIIQQLCKLTLLSSNRGFPS